MYPGGQAEPSGSVKAYFALKLTGHDPSAEYMRRAREAILAHGGADAVNSFTRFYLALLGQISYEQCPAVPPELVLLPRWFPVSLYAMSAWSRTIVVPLSIMSALRPVRRIEPRLGIRELFLREPEDWPPLRCPGLRAERGQSPRARGDVLSPCGVGTASSALTDRLLKWCQRRRLLPLRQKALAAAERWMRTRFDRSDGLGAIYPPMVWSIIALKCLGYPDDSPELQYCHEELRKLCIDDEQSGTTRLQPCKSPVWDTAIAVRALRQSGVRPENPALREAVRWLLDRQIHRRGDWAETVAAEPGGWCFEYANDFYPDCDDTAMVLMALQTQFSGPPRRGKPCRPSCGWPDALPRRRRLALKPQARARQRRSPVQAVALRGWCPSEDDHQRAAELEDTVLAVERGLRWLLAMQNRDGGWGAFDRNNHREFLCHVPFADHNAMIDPSTPDLAGRVLEALGQLGRRLGDPAVDRAVAYVRRAQNPDGSWFGRWGVNYIYGTWQAITGLTAVGVPARRSGGGGGGQLAVGPSAAQRRLGRVARKLRVAAPPRPRPADGLANRLGAAGPAGRRHGGPRGRRPRRPLPPGHAERGRHVGRAAVHRHRLPAGLLPAIPLLSDLLPADGAVAVGGESQSRQCRIERSAFSNQTKECRMTNVE